MNTQLILNYLSDLSVNNNREWYHEHKAENKAANTEFEALVGALILRISEFDSSVLHNEPKNLTFKLVRTPLFFPNSFRRILPFPFPLEQLHKV